MEYLYIKYKTNELTFDLFYPIKHKRSLLLGYPITLIMLRPVEDFLSSEKKG